MADRGRLRTAYDRLVMAGMAPHIPGGNPTPGEAVRQAADDARRDPRERWGDWFK